MHRGAAAGHKVIRYNDRSIVKSPDLSRVYCALRLHYTAEMDERNFWSDQKAGWPWPPQPLRRPWHIF